MKYKKHIATGVIALSLFVTGPSVYAATSTNSDLIASSTVGSYNQGNKQNKHLSKKTRMKQLVGTISSINSAGFTAEVKSLKTGVATSIDVQTGTSTIYKKDGVISDASSLVVGQKVIVKGSKDSATNIVSATKVNVITKQINTSGEKISRKTKKIYTNKASSSSVDSKLSNH